MKCAIDDLKNKTIGKLIEKEKYKFVDKNIISEVCRDIINSLIYEGDLK